MPTDLYIGKYIYRLTRAKLERFVIVEKTKTHLCFISEGCEIYFHRKNLNSMVLGAFYANSEATVQKQLKKLIAQNPKDKFKYIETYYQGHR